MPCMVRFGVMVLAGGRCISPVSPCMGDPSLGHGHTPPETLFSPGSLGVCLHQAPLLFCP